MPKLPSAAKTFCLRLKAARLSLGISQAELGIRIGLEPGVSSARINRYELGIHMPDVDTAERIARELGVPLAHLFAGDERLAEAIRLFAVLSPADQDRMLVALSEAGAAASTPKPAKKSPHRGR